SLQDRARHLRDRLLRSRLLPIIDLSTAKLDRYLDAIRRMRPAMMFGYPSAMAQLAFRAEQRGLDMGHLGIRVAFTTSEIARPHWRHAITRVFRCPVADEYGARDAGYIARECPAGSLHITAEYMVVEILDEAGHPVPDGHAGEVVLTNLSSWEAPVLRY